MMGIPGHSPRGSVPSYNTLSSDVRHNWTDNEVPMTSLCTGCGARSSMALVYTWRNNIDGEGTLDVLEPGAWIEVRPSDEEYGRSFLFCYHCYDFIKYYVEDFKM